MRLQLHLTFLYLLLILFGAATPSTAGLVAHWPFDEASGSSAADVAGDAHDGALLGSPRWTEGAVGGALAFGAAADRMSIPDHPDLDFGASLTIAAWLRPDRKGTQYVVRKGRYGESDGYALNLSSSGKLFARFNQHSEGNAFKLLSSRPYPTDGTTWIHAAMTFDGQEIRLYLDGALDVSLAAPGLVIAQNAEPLSVGAQMDGLRPFDGSIDELRLYDRALSAAEVQELSIVEPPAEEEDGTADAEDTDPEDIDPEDADPEDADPEDADPEDAGEGMGSDERIGHWTLFKGLKNLKLDLEFLPAMAGAV